MYAENSVEKTTKNTLGLSAEALKELQTHELKIRKYMKKKEQARKRAEALKKSLELVATKIKALLSTLGVSASFLGVILIIIIVIAAFVGSCFGIFLNEEENKTSKNPTMTVKQAIIKLQDTIQDEINEIVDSVEHNTTRITIAPIDYKSIIAIYSVTTTNRNKNKEIITITEKDYEELEDIFFKVVTIEHHIEKYKVTRHREDGSSYSVSKKRLVIDVSCMTLEEMMNKMRLSKKEKMQVEEMLSSDYDTMWQMIM